jgi:hypothetical protein
MNVMKSAHVARSGGAVYTSSEAVDPDAQSVRGDVFLPYREASHSLMEGVPNEQYEQARIQRESQSERI